MARATQDELEKALAEGADVKRLEAPFFYASSVSIAFGSNDCSLTFSRGHPILIDKGNARIQAGTIEPVALIALSPQSAKDLHVLLGDQIASYEAQWGPLTTEFMKRSEKSSKAQVADKEVTAPTKPAPVKKAPRRARNG